ncbi:unnamed protein product (macronuclear) [Paramecium tetraurelia]|uniref:Uncharacterized protein n=1 Tax=Paramecium tetraurelia TaxID=5888 RepID=A0C8R0_PARTE|nr:uncharacterized protein GSPATT00036312001 [Paramecium tetraurelia]CAK67177.1 unnamed protein product [Paramecium tetraurelia]|eukprot:XP_001434574.1 hypothetical protein (macronuclear) [Paramecium tetraurelia strain d4-2]
MSARKVNGNKQTKISLGEIDDMFNDAEFTQAIKDVFKKQSNTARNDWPTQTTNMFYQKATISQIMRQRAKGSLTGTMCPSLKKEERKSRWASLIGEGRTEHRIRVPSETENIPICAQYEQYSYLCREHEQLIQNLSELPQSIKMMLYSNQYEVQRAKMCENKTILDEKFIFTLFNTLQQLDKQIIEPLHQQTRPVLNFKMHFVQNAVNLVSDTMVQSVREALKHDTRLGIFLEGFCKFWIVLIDIQLQWMGKSCADYIETQVKEFKEQFKQAVAQKIKVEDQMIQMDKEFKAMEAQYIRKNEYLQQQLLSVQQEFQDYIVTVQQMSDLRIAEERMNSVGLKALELESMFKQYDKVVAQHSFVFQKDIKELGSALIKQQKLNQPLPMKHQEAQVRLGCHKLQEENYQLYYLNSVGIFMQVHPFQIPFEVNKELEMDYSTLLCNFLDYLTQIGDFLNHVCRIFIDWVGEEEKLNAILTYLSECDLDQPINQLYAIIFGIREHRQLSSVSLKKVLKYYKELQEQHEYQLNECFTIKDASPYFQLLFSEEFNEKVYNSQKSQMTLLELLLMLAQHFLMIENKQWTGWIYKQEIQSEDLDMNVIKQFIELRSQLNRPLEESLELVRQLSLLHPELFYKSKQVPQERMKASARKVQRKNSQRSPLKRSSIMIKAINLKK